MNNSKDILDLLVQLVSQPFKALFSRRFYVRQILQERGVGLVYTMFLCALLALPGTWQVKKALNNIDALELSTVVSKIPASYISPQGVLSANNEQDGATPLIIRNSKGEAVLAYNLNGDDLSTARDPERPIGDLAPKAVPLTLTAHALLVRTEQDVIELPWSALYGTSGANFEPLAAAHMLEQAVDSSYLSIMFVVWIWLFSCLAFIVLVAGLITKGTAGIVLKTRVSFRLSLCICSYGATLVGLLLLAQFFMNIVLSYLILCLVPVIYAISALAYLKASFERSRQDFDFAFNPGNPVYLWCNTMSRMNINPARGFNRSEILRGFDNGADYFELDEEARAVRRERLAQAFKLFPDVSSMINMKVRIIPSQGAGAYGYGPDGRAYQDSTQSEAEARSADSQSRQNGTVDHSAHTTSNSSPDTGADPADSSRGAGPEGQQDQQSRNSRNPEHRPDDLEQNPYFFNDQGGLDDPVFTERDDLSSGSGTGTPVARSGEVRRGENGQDSSFTP